MRHESRKFLDDMLDAGQTIDRAISGKTEADYLNDRVLRDAVQWNFCVIGEALTQLKQQDEDTAEKITDFRKIIGFRNQLIHGYGVINHEITWQIAKVKLPILLREIEELLRA